MSTLIAITYPNEQRAQEVLAELRKLQTQYLIDLEDSVIVTKDVNGNTKLHQAVDLTTEGAINGATWGFLLGLIITLPFPFLAPLAWLGIAAASAGIGALVGGLTGKASDYGIDDDFIKNLSANMEAGTSTLFILARSVTLDKVEPDVAKYGGKIIYTNLNKEAEAQLRATIEKGVQQVQAAQAAPPAP
jgi:uncharacterized membrane protein